MSIDAEGGTERIECDVLAMSGGWNPAVAPDLPSRRQAVWDDALAAFVPARCRPA